MSVGAVAGVGMVAQPPVLPPQLLRLDTARQVEALTRLAITPSIRPEQLAVALGVTVKEVAGLVEAYQAALRTLLSSTGFWLPAVDAEVADVLPLVDPRAPAAGVPRLAAVLNAGMEASGRGAFTPGSAAGEVVPGSVHGAYLRAVGLRPAAEALAGAADVSASGVHTARLAIQVGAGPAGIVFLLDDAVVPSAGSVHAAAHHAVVAAGHGKAPTTVVAQLAAASSAALNPSAEIPATPLATAHSPPVAKTSAGVPADGFTASAGSGVSPMQAKAAEVSAPPVREALLAAKDNPRAGYRAWPGPPVPTEPVPAGQVDAYARMAAPSRGPLLLGAAQPEAAAPMAAASMAAAPMAEPPIGARQVLVAAAGDAPSSNSTGKVVSAGPDGAVVVADGRAVPAAVEAARQEPERVAALVLDLTSLIRAALELSTTGEAAKAAASLATTAGVLPNDPGRLMELLAATTLARESAPPPHRRRRRRPPEPDTSGLAHDFFAALFSIRVADDVLTLDVPVTVLGPELPQLAALAEGLDRDRATLTMRLTDLPMVEVLEVLRLG